MPQSVPVPGQAIAVDRLSLTAEHVCGAGALSITGIYPVPFADDSE